MTGATVSAMPLLTTNAHSGIAQRLLLQDWQAIAKSSAVWPSR